MAQRPPSMRPLGAPVDARKRYDDTTRKSDPTLREAARLRNSKRWRVRRVAHLKRSPLCVDPFGEHGNDAALGQQVHHIVGLQVAPHLAFTSSNLATLCTACHARVEQMERRGEPTQALFAHPPYMGVDS